MTVNLLRTLRTLALTAALCTATAFAVEQGDEAPAWSARDFSGRTVAFPDATAGKPAVVMFWAMWCPYCTSRSAR
jgi:thiol-disulfide isomerase/thioredoxin